MTALRIGHWAHIWGGPSNWGLEWALGVMEASPAPESVLLPVPYPMPNRRWKTDDPAQADALLSRIPDRQPITLRTPSNLMDSVSDGAGGILAPGIPRLPALNVIDPYGSVDQAREHARGLTLMGRRPKAWEQFVAWAQVCQPASIYVLDNNEGRSVPASKLFRQLPAAQAEFPGLADLPTTEVNQIIGEKMLVLMGAFYDELVGRFRADLGYRVDLRVIPYHGLCHGEQWGYRWSHKPYDERPPLAEGPLNVSVPNGPTSGPLYFDASSPSIYDNAWENTADCLIRSPLVRCSGVRAAVDFAREVDPADLQTISLWAGQRRMLSKYGSIIPGDHASPERTAAWYTLASLTLLSGAGDGETPIALLFQGAYSDPDATDDDDDPDSMREHEQAAIDALSRLNTVPALAEALRFGVPQQGPWRYPFSGVAPSPREERWFALRSWVLGTGAPLYPDFLDRPPEGQPAPGKPPGSWMSGSFNPNAGRVEHAAQFAAYAVELAIGAPSPLAGARLLSVWGVSPEARSQPIEVELSSGERVAVDLGGLHLQHWIVAADLSVSAPEDTVVTPTTPPGPPPVVPPLEERLAEIELQLAEIRRRLEDAGIP